MEIAEHDISFRTTHSLREEHSVSETFVFATRGARERVQRTTDGEGNVEEQRQRQNIPDQDQVEVSDEAQEASEAEKNKFEFELTTQQKMELKMIRMTLDRIGDGEFEFIDPEEFLDQLEKAGNGELGKDEKQSEASESSEGGSEGEGANFGFSYNYHERYAESEKLTFQAGGQIRTADGQEIDFQLDLNISRSFFRETSVQIQGGNAKLVDPLVVNFEGKAAELEQNRFSFDLNADGVEEEIARLAPGSGFLAKDENGNGEIDDGGELFGPETGRGFDELAEHDEDGNGFIDSGDSVFDDLKLMTFNHSGDRALISLEEAGIGAIFLGSADTDFSYKTRTENQLQGQLKRTGVFIGTDGNVGSVQEMDFAVETPDEAETDQNDGESADGEEGPAGASEMEQAREQFGNNFSLPGREGLFGGGLPGFGGSFTENPNPGSFDFRV